MARGVNDVLTDRRTLDWGKKIAVLEPQAYPLLAWGTTLGKEAAVNQKFVNFEDRPYARWFYVGTVTGAGPLTGLKLEIVENDAAYVAASAYIKARDTLYCEAKDHTMLVTNVNTATGEITVTGLYAGRGDLTNADGRIHDTADVVSDAHADPADGDRIVHVSNTYPDGGNAGTPHALPLTEVFNFIQKMQTPYDIDIELMKAELAGGPELKRLQARKAIEHAKSQELQFILGDRDARVDGNGKMVYTTAGLAHMGLTTDSVATAAFNETAFRSFLRNLFSDEMNKRKLLLCGGQVVEAIDAWAMGRLVINDELSAVLGMKVPTYMTSFGTVDIVYHPLLVNSFEGWAFGLDPEQIKIKTYGGDTVLETAIQANDAMERLDEYRTWFGLKLGLLECHRWLKVT